MLKYRADIRTLAFVGAYYGLTLFSWFIYPKAPWYLVGLLVLALCLSSFFCAIIVHNTVHHPIFKSRRLNKLFQVILSLSYGHAVSSYVPGHNLSHHKNTQGNKDIIRTTKARFKWNFLNQALFFFLMSGKIVSDELRFAKEMYKKKPRWFAQYVLEFVFVIGIKAALLIVDWQRALILVIIPHQFAVWGVVGTNYWQHDGCAHGHEYNDSRSFTSPVLNWWCFNNGYHGMHHRKPSLHWSVLPENHEKYIVPHVHPNLNQRSLFKYLWRTCIYPGRRLNFDGSPFVLPPKEADGDWISDVSLLYDSQDLGAEV